jgi:diaminopimelate epimerase
MSKPMPMPFTKMHALGNDFLIFRANGAQRPDTGVIRRLADRNTGIGFDQLLWLEAGKTEGADIFYRIFNSDGNEAEQCGNGARCIARLIAGDAQRTLTLEHVGGMARARIESDGNVTIEMGVPEFQPDLIPFNADAEQPSYDINVNGETVTLSVVSIGNPHAVITVDSVADAPVETLGSKLESHARFPNHANIGFMQIVASDHVRLRVFERGVGETSACGTGACAAAVVGHQSGRLDENVTVDLPGGELSVLWEGPGTPVWLTGEAVTIYEGMVQI